MISLDSKNKKVLFLQHDSVFESYGGVQYYLNDFLNFLADSHGNDALQVVLAYRGPKFKLTSRPYKIETLKLAGGFLRKFENRFSPKFFLKSLQFLKKEKYAVIIASHISLAPMAALLSKLTGTPFVVIAYGFEVWGGFYPQDKWALQKADGIISISHWTRSILEKQGFDPKKISIVHPCLSQEIISKKRGTISQSDTSSPNKTLKLLTVSRLDASEQYKGHDHVLLALALLRRSDPNLSFSYTIQGDGNDSQRLQEKVHELQLQNWVTFIPGVTDRTELEESYSGHDVFIMPSRFGYWDHRWRGEGFGIVYVEAGFFGMPSIAYRCGGVMDIIKHEQNGLLVEPDNIEALAESIRALANNRSQILKLGETANQMALENFIPSQIKLELQKALQFNLRSF